jgi:hypothetical protein
MEWIKGKKLLAIAMLALVTASVAGCYAPYRRYAYYDHDQRDYRRDDNRRDDDRRGDRYDWHRDHDRWRRDRDRR